MGGLTYNNLIRSYCFSSGGITSYSAVNQNKVNGFPKYNVVKLCQNYAHWCRNFKEVGIRMQWRRL